jgi:hypothetical protein
MLFSFVGRRAKDRMDGGCWTYEDRLLATNTGIEPTGTGINDAIDGKRTTYERAVRVRPRTSLVRLLIICTFDTDVPSCHKNNANGNGEFSLWKFVSAGLEFHSEASPFHKRARSLLIIQTIVS